MASVATELLPLIHVTGTVVRLLKSIHTGSATVHRVSIEIYGTTRELPNNLTVHPRPECKHFAAARAQEARYSMPTVLAALKLALPHPTEVGNDEWSGRVRNSSCRAVAGRIPTEQIRLVRHGIGLLRYDGPRPSVRLKVRPVQASGHMCQQFQPRRIGCPIIKDTFRPSLHNV